MAAPSKAWVVIADSQIDADSPLDTTLVTALRDDVVHLEEWLGDGYTAVKDHDHDAVNSKSVVLGNGAVTNAKINGGVFGAVTVPESVSLSTSSWTTFYTFPAFIYIPAGVTKIKVRGRNKRTSGTNSVAYRLTIGSDNGASVNGVQSTTWTNIDLEITPSAGNKGTYVQLLFQYNAVTGTIGAFHKTMNSGGTLPDTADDYSLSHYFSD